MMQIFEVMCNLTHSISSGCMTCVLDLIEFGINYNYNCQVVGTVPRVTILICILTYIIIHGILFKRVSVRLFLLNLLVF
jgi:hypothetical protein